MNNSGEGNGTLLQYSCLENPRDWGAWWAAVYGVAQSWTRMTWLSSSSSKAISHSFSRVAKISRVDVHVSILMDEEMEAQAGRMTWRNDVGA